MKQIALTGKFGEGKYAIVDSLDYPELSQYNWHMRIDGYVMRSTWIDGLKKKLRMHREIMNAPVGLVVDHINGNPLDNRRGNLRVCTQAENTRNKSKRKTNNGYKGVRFMKSRNTWRAEIIFNYEYKYLGEFKDIKQAVDAYNKKSVELFGKYAKPNIYRTLNGRTDNTCPVPSWY